MTDLQYGTHAQTYPSIQPIQVIERWALCHHLGCVVKYIARVGCTSPILEQTRLSQTRLSQTRLIQMRLKDLKKAEFYLVRKINNEQTQKRVFQTRVSQQCRCHPAIQGTLVSPFPLMPEVVSEDWGLSPRLAEIVFYINTFQKLFDRFPQTRVICLKQALHHLREEINAYEHLTNNPEGEGK